MKNLLDVVGLSGIVLGIVIAVFCGYLAGYHLGFKDGHKEGRIAESHDRRELVSKFNERFEDMKEWRQ